MAPSLTEVAAQLRDALQQVDGPAKERVRVALQRLALPALATDDRARFVVTNDAAAQLTGYAEHELLRLGVPDITSVSDEPHTESLWNAFSVQGRQSGRYDIRRKDGGIITVEYFAIANVVPGMHVSLLQPVTK